MSRARHKGSKSHRASGGATVAGGNPHVFSLAKEGGHGAVGGAKGSDRMDRKRGGACHASGGKVGSDTSPYTSAHAHGGKVGGKGKSFHHNAGRGR